MPDPDDAWVQEGFLERLDQWADIEEPPEGVRLQVTSWIMTRLDDPYQGVVRAAGFDNLWYGAVPGSGHGDGLVVVCSYWIMEREHRLRCDSFASLSRPV